MTTLETQVQGLPPKDTRWRISKHGEENARPAQLDVSKFSAQIVTAANGIKYIPSGTGVQFAAGGLIPAASGKVSGFINDDYGVVLTEGATKYTCSVLVHGIVNISQLPAGTKEAVGTSTVNGFTFVKDGEGA